MEISMHKFIIFAILLLISVSVAQKTGGGGEAFPNLKTNPEILQKWQDLKFGLFIHWGPVALRGTEIGWSRGKQVPIEEYDSLYNEFNPMLFDATEWVRIAKTAGMKYLIITTKHHDGFSLFDSEYTNYDIMATPYGRDVLKELAEECKKQDILFGTYYSIADWKHPHYTTRYGGDPRPVEESNMDRYIVFMKNQLRELVENYDTNILWFDGEWEGSWNHEYGMDLYSYCRELKHNVLINNRVDKGRRGFQGTTISNNYAGDFGTPEQEIGTFNIEEPWESCITICKQWAWKPNDHMKSLRECLHTLVQTVGCGGNLLFNVGPMLDGRIEQRQIERLNEMGEWLNLNGNSIYGTKGGPFKPTSWMVSTHRENSVYVHLLYWPDKKLLLPNLPDHDVVAVKLMNGEPLEYESATDYLTIVLPEMPPDENVSVLRLDLDSPAGQIKPLDVPPNELRDLFFGNLSLMHLFSPKYASNGIAALNDKLRGSNNYADGKWLGFEGDDFEAIIDLGSERAISKVKLGCLRNQNSWIFFPVDITVLASNDGEKFYELANKKYNSLQKDDAVVKKDFTVQLKTTETRFLKIVAKNTSICPDWHKGAGGKAWLFVDEIIVE
jgi:alpha-L-fucosidase